MAMAMATPVLESGDAGAPACLPTSAGRHSFKLFLPTTELPLTILRHDRKAHEIAQAAWRMAARRLGFAMACT